MEEIKSKAIAKIIDDPEEANQKEIEGLESEVNELIAHIQNMLKDDVSTEFEQQEEQFLWQIGERQNLLGRVHNLPAMMSKTVRSRERETCEMDARRQECMHHTQRAARPAGVVSLCSAAGVGHRCSPAEPPAIIRFVSLQS